MLHILTLQYQENICIYTFLSLSKYFFIVILINLFTEHALYYGSSATSTTTSGDGDTNSLSLDSLSNASSYSIDLIMPIKNYYTRSPKVKSSSSSSKQQQQQQQQQQQKQQHLQQYQESIIASIPKSISIKSRVKKERTVGIACNDDNYIGEDAIDGKDNGDDFVGYDDDHLLNHNDDNNSKEDYYENSDDEDEDGSNVDDDENLF